MTPFEEIEQDLDWREAELAAMRLLIVGAKSEFEKLVLTRAAWALLYAHFEGFTKFALTVYYDELQRLGKKVSDLPVETQCFSLRPKLKEIRNLPTQDMLEALKNFSSGYLGVSCSFPDVDTKSNLYADTLNGLVIDAGINLPSLSLYNNKINTLVRRRNKIAHGEKDLISEFDYYISFEDAIKTILYDLALEIDRKIEEYGP
jgi:hypothetical protein